MSKPSKSLAIDVAKYQDLLDAPDLSDEEKAAFLEALWSLIVAFVDLGFDVKALEETDESQTLVPADVVKSRYETSNAEAAHE